MNEKQLFEENLKTLDRQLLKLHANNHKRRKYIRELITDELLTYFYIDQQQSAHSIAKYFLDCGINISGADYVIKRLKNKNIITRDAKTTANLETVKNKQKQTLFKQYGVENISQIPEVKQKKQQKCLDTYGVTNNFKAEEIKKKIKEFWQREYGVDHISEIFPIKNKYSLTRPHKVVIGMLNQLNISHEVETSKYFKAFNACLQKKFCPRVDIFVPKLKLVIEIFGSYWHANPRRYSENCLFHTFKGVMTAKEVWQKDQVKIDHIKNLGYNIEIVWDDEITIKKIEEIITKYED